MIYSGALGQIFVVSKITFESAVDLCFRSELLAPAIHCGLQKVRIEPQDLPVEQRHLTEQAVGVTMSDVHALASAYGWTESDVLGMTSVRRQAYLSLAVG